MRNLSCRHFQVDEIWTFVGKKQGKLDADTKRMIFDQGDIYLWVPFDETTKLIPTFLLGKRTGDNARRLMVDLASRCNLPRATDTGVRPGVKPQISTDGFNAYPEAVDLGIGVSAVTPNSSWFPAGAPARQINHELHLTASIPQISTDGFNAYPEAVDLAFADNCKYGILVKDYRNSDMPGRYAAPELIGAERRVIRGAIDNYDICTSHVERNNLTIRTFMKRFARLSLGFSKKLQNLAAATALHVAYFNFCWEMRNSHGKGNLSAPAVAAGIIPEVGRSKTCIGRSFDAGTVAMPCGFVTVQSYGIPTKYLRIFNG